MTTRAYAEGTSVSVEKSKAEIDTLLGKHSVRQRLAWTGSRDVESIGSVFELSKAIARASGAPGSRCA